MNLLVLIITFLAHGSVSSISEHPVVIVVAFDGFSFKYIEESRTPNIIKIRKEGTHAEFVRNVFVTKTFPNFFSVSTGLYPETHGVLDNSYYDPVNKKVVQYSSELFHYKEDILPVWTLNEIEDKTRFSGIMMWPGGEFQYRGRNTKFCEPLNMTVPWEERIETVMKWIQDPDTPANLVMVYFEEPDETAHVYGPKHENTFKAIMKVDTTINLIYEKIRDLGLSNSVNVLILSDHGMTTVPYSNIIDLTQYVNPSYFIKSGSTPTLGFFPHEGFHDTVYEALKNASKTEQFSLFLKEDIFSYWRFKNNSRCPPILAVADLGYAFYDVIEHRIEATQKHNIAYNASFGMHGYSNEESDMWPFFLAFGRDIKKNYILHPFDSIDFYPLIIRLLNLSILKYESQGDIRNVEDMIAIRQAVVPPAVWKYLAITMSVVSGVLIVLFSIFHFLHVRKLKQKLAKTESACFYTPLPDADAAEVLFSRGAESESSESIAFAADDNLVNDGVYSYADCRADDGTQAESVSLLSEIFGSM